MPRPVLSGAICLLVAVSACWLGWTLKSANQETATRAKYLNLGQSVHTPLTPDSAAETSATGDMNQDTYVYFRSRGIDYWTALVSTATVQVVLPADRGNQLITFEKGLTVTFSPQSDNRYVVLLDGTIIDGGTVYPIKGKLLGAFSTDENQRVELIGSAAPRTR